MRKLIKLTIVTLTIVISLTFTLWFVFSSNEEIDNSDVINVSIDDEYLKELSLFYLSINKKLVGVNERLINAKLVEKESEINATLYSKAKINYLGAKLDFSTDYVSIKASVSYKELPIIDYQTIVDIKAKLVRIDDKITFSIEKVSVGKFDIKLPLGAAEYFYNKFLFGDDEDSFEVIGGLNLEKDLVATIIVSELNSFLAENFVRLPLAIEDISLLNDNLVIGFELSAKFKEYANFISLILKERNFLNRIEALEVPDFFEVLKICSDKISIDSTDFSIDYSKLTEEDQESFYNSFNALELDKQSEIITILMEEFEQSYPAIYAEFREA